MHLSVSDSVIVPITPPSSSATVRLPASFTEGFGHVATPHLQPSPPHQPYAGRSNNNQISAEITTTAINQRTDINPRLPIGDEYSKSAPGNINDGADAELREKVLDISPDLH